MNMSMMRIRLGLACLVVMFCGVFAAGQDLAGYADGGYDSWTAFLRAEKVAILSAEVDGVVVAVSHEPQDFVSAGETLVELDSTLVEMNVARLRTQLELNTDIAQAETALEYAEDNLAIVQSLYETEVGGARVGSPKEYREATQRRDMAQFGLQEARMGIQLLELELQQNEEMLSRHTITAPMDGVVVPFSSLNMSNYDQVKQLVAGEMVSRGQVVMALMKVDRLRVSENLPLGRLDDVYVGQSVDVFVQGAGGDAIEGSVVYISPTIGSTGEFTVEVELDNPVASGGADSGYRYQFRPGMSARIELGQ